MLSELHVRGLALVEDVWLEFAPGLTVLTGETGAGKTVLVSALKLLLGERADSTMVRQGSDEALVEGRIVIDGAEVVVKRRLSAEGRSRCSIDGEMATVAMLAELLGPHVDLHGQHEHQALLSAAHHAGYLDRFIGQSAAAALEQYRVGFRAHAEARAHLKRIEGALTDRDSRTDYLRFQITDIDAVAPTENELAEIDARLPRLRHGERLTAAASTAWAALKEEAGASERLSDALGALGPARGLDPEMDALAEVVERIDVELQDVASALRDYAEGVGYDPAALDEAEHRLQQLSDLARKYGPTLGDVLQARELAISELETLDAGEAGAEQARAAVSAAAARLREAATRLSQVRESGVAPFTTRLKEAASALALPSATFAVARTELPFESWTAESPERVEFLFAAGAGEDPRPLARVASGGEVSRVMLALKSVLGSADSVPVLVFDEVDAGIGGATARAVGQRLKALSADHQVLVVTHLPQVAAFAGAHIVVSKAASGDRTVTTARRIEADDLVAEIARMLAGSTSETSMAHARELLADASEDAGPRAVTQKG